MMSMGVAALRCVVQLPGVPVRTSPVDLAAGFTYLQPFVVDGVVVDERGACDVVDLVLEEEGAVFPRDSYCVAGSLDEL